MRVTVKFYGVYRDFLNRSGLELELPEGTTTRQLLHQLCSFLGQNFHQRVFAEDGGLHRYISLSVNDRLISSEQLDEILTLNEAQQPHVSVLFIPPMFGGA